MNTTIIQYRLIYKIMQYVGFKYNKSNNLSAYKENLQIFAFSIK